MGLRKLGDDAKRAVDPSALQKNVFEQVLTAEMAAAALPSGIASVWQSADKAALITTVFPSKAAAVLRGASGGAGHNVAGAAGGAAGAAGAGSGAGSAAGAGGAGGAGNGTSSAGGASGGVGSVDDVVVCEECSTRLWNKAVEEWRWAADASLIPARAQGRPDCWYVCVHLSSVI